jgi:malic enzyme
MAESSTITREMIEAAAAAIANARGGRRGAPEIRNVLEILPAKLKAEVLEDAEAALTAALATGGARG